MRRRVVEVEQSVARERDREPRVLLRERLEGADLSSDDIMLFVS